MAKLPPYRARDSPAMPPPFLSNGGFFVPFFTRRQSRKPGEMPETKQKYKFWRFNHGLF